MNELIGGRGWHVHTGAKVGYEQELADRLAITFERHDKTGDAHLLAGEALHHWRPVPLLAHALHERHRARVVVLQIVELEVSKELLGVPVGRDQIIPADLTKARLAALVGAGEAVADLVAASGLRPRG